MKKRLEALDLTTIEERRQRRDLINMYKIIHDIDKCYKSNRFKIINNQVRSHCFKYHKEITKQQQRENFFFNKTANLWNFLPNKLVESPTVNSFKAGIDCWMSSNRSDRLS